MTKRLNIINHTHWDREWYESFETFRGKLIKGIELIVKGLDNGQFKSFMLDGQTVILEDLAEVLEDGEYKKLINYIKSGRIDVGPWYVLPDEFLVSGESIIRNLKIGTDISAQYGKKDFVGYLPDTFGHIGQLPQIFKGLNIDCALLFRGVHSKSSEVIFEGSDHTEIKAIILPLWEGYYNHFLTYDDYTKRLEIYLDKIQKFTDSEELLLLNGADHLIPHENLNDRLTKLESDLDIVIEQTNLKEYISRLDNSSFVEIIYGEQRDERKAYILPNVASSRSYLKKQNGQLEDKLTHIAEPLELIKSIVTNKYKYKFLHHTWKSLLKNHPHDSICGCSIDSVHSEMETRNVKINDMLESIKHYAAKEIIKSKPIDNNKIYIFNPLPYKYEGVVEAILNLPTNIENFKITDIRNKYITMEILSSENKQIFLADVDLEPNWYEVHQFKVALKSNFKGMGFTEYNIVNDIKKEEEIYRKSFLENSYVKVSINSKGYVDILNKQNNKLYENTNMFVSSLDAGDEYTYSPPINDCVSTANFVGVNNIIINDVTQELVVIYNLEQPESLDEHRNGQSLKKVITEIKSTIRILGNSKTVEFTTEINNKAKDQRLRIVFPLCKGVKKFYTDVSFDNVERVPLENITYDAEKQSEVRVNTHPTDSYAYIKNEFGIIHTGLQEVEVSNYGNFKDAVYLTVMRSVGWLSRDDFRTRGGGAGPNMATPDAQCLGKNSFNYAITFEDNVPFEAKKIRIKPVVFQGNDIENALENILILDNKNIIISAFYKNSKDEVILRLYNPKEQVELLHIDCFWKEIYETNLLEEEEKLITGSIEVSAKKILTLKLK
ncbi:glycoside hydrolase family 38 C-terminal domain-containing protein [Clostridium sp.]|uniref:glycoside hydrolase family 38 N-terminal domain-containing protein n=1 Tax=Clostridium sp. TaxID=1506 RepID=UPI003D6CCDB8